MSLLSLLDESPKTYQLVCCLYSKEPGGVYSWGGPFYTLEDAHASIQEKYPDVEPADGPTNLTLGLDFGETAWENSWDVVAVYETGTGYVERLYHVEPRSPFQE